MCSPDGVGQQQHHGTGQGAQRQDPPVVRPGQGAHRVRDHEPDEGDGPGQGHGRPAQEGDPDEDQGPGRTHPGAQGPGHVIAQGEAVDGAGHPHGQEQAQQDQGQAGAGQRLGVAGVSAASTACSPWQ